LGAAALDLEWAGGVIERCSAYDFGLILSLGVFELLWCAWGGDSVYPLPPLERLSILQITIMRNMFTCASTCIRITSSDDNYTGYQNEDSFLEQNGVEMICNDIV
jgi:hypothetical protein